MSPFCMFVLTLLYIPFGMESVVFMKKNVGNLIEYIFTAEKLITQKSTNVALYSIHVDARVKHFFSSTKP